LDAAVTGLMMVAPPILDELDNAITVQSPAASPGVDEVHEMVAYV